MTVILDSLAEGATKEEVLASYPTLRVHQINAALAYGRIGARRASHTDTGNVKFKLDENVPAELVTDLRPLGHDAYTVTDEGLAGATDPTIVDAVSAL